MPDAEIVITPTGPTIIKTPSPLLTQQQVQQQQPFHEKLEQAQLQSQYQQQQPFHKKLEQPQQQSQYQLQQQQQQQQQQQEHEQLQKMPDSRPPPLPASVQVSVVSAQISIDNNNQETEEELIPVFSMANAKPDQDHHDYEDVVDVVTNDNSNSNMRESSSASMDSGEIPVMTGVLKLKVDEDLPVKKIKAKDAKTFQGQNFPIERSEVRAEVGDHQIAHADIEQSHQDFIEQSSLNFEVGHNQPLESIPRDIADETHDMVHETVPNEDNKDYEVIEFKNKVNDANDDGKDQMLPTTLLEVPDLVRDQDNHSSNSNKSPDSLNSIDLARRDILEGIREMDSTIQNLRNGMIKVYEDICIK